MNELKDHVDVLECDGRRVKYVQTRLRPNVKPPADDQALPEADFAFDAVTVTLEPVTWDLHDRDKLDEMAYELLDITPEVLDVSLPVNKVPARQAFQWAVNYEAKTAAMLVYYPEALEEARALT